MLKTKTKSDKSVAKKSKASTSASHVFAETLQTKSYSFLEYYFAAFIGAFLLSNIVQMFVNPNFSSLSGYYTSISKGLFFIVMILAFAAQVVFWKLLKLQTVIPWTLICSTLVLSVLYAINVETKSLYFIVGIAFVVFVVVSWLVKDDKLQLEKLNLSYKAVFISVCVLFLAATIFVGYCSSLKYKSYMNSTFDFGIFCQMFENMASHGVPDTTVERNELLSHFGVHFSPVFYLLLPGYMIFRSPEYLLFAQAFCVGLGVFAVFLICKKLEYSPRATLAFSVIYLAFPTMFNGCYRDFHENKLLSVIIMFMMYFVISRNIYGTFGFALLTMSVKEDAAIYVMVIALYMILATKDKIRGALVFLMAVIYFMIAQSVISANGTEGVMMWRLSSYFVDGEQTFFSVFKGIFYDIGNLIKNMFTADKVAFLIWMLMPVAFTPIVNKKLSTLVLLAPMIPINLMQDWQYQYDIDFQYTYGVAALVIFASIATVLHLKKDTQRRVLLFGVIVSIVMFSNLSFVKGKSSIKTYEAMEITAENTTAVLDTIPKDATVTAAETFVPHIADIDQLYSFPARYGSNSQTDYIVLDTRYKGSEGYDPSALMGNNYTLIDSNGMAELYIRNDLK